jgi:hypothetical protein
MRRLLSNNVSVSMPFFLERNDRANPVVGPIAASAAFALVASTAQFRHA